MSEPLPLFPLNTGLFPGVVMPLHIFEQRYRQLMRDLIALPASHDRQFGVVAIKTGFERRMCGDDILEGETPHEPVDLSYTIAAALPLAMAERQRLLECPDVATRLRTGTALVRSELRAMDATASLPAASLAHAPWTPN